jgi:hypothetical protein
MDERTAILSPKGRAGLSPEAVKAMAEDPLEPEGVRSVGAVK